MCLEAAVYGVLAQAEGGADARDLQGGTQKGAAQALAFEIVVTAGFAFGGEPDRLMAGVVVDEFQGQDLPGAHFAPFVRIGFVYQAEAVAFADVAQEVDFAAEDVGHFKRDPVGYAGFVGSAKQGAFDNPFGNAHVGLRRVGNFGGLEAAFAVGRDFQPLGRVAVIGTGAGRVPVAQPYQAAVGVECRLDDTARVQLAAGAGVFFLDEELLQARLGHLQPLQQGGQGVAAPDGGFADERGGVVAG